MLNRHRLKHCRAIRQSENRRPPNELPHVPTEADSFQPTFYRTQHDVDEREIKGEVKVCAQEAHHRHVIEAMRIEQISRTQQLIEIMRPEVIAIEREDGNPHRRFHPKPLRISTLPICLPRKEDGEHQTRHAQRDGYGEI